MQNYNNAASAKEQGEQTEKDYVLDTLRAGRNVLLLVFFISFFVNLLVLISPIYMLQIYDRVMTSGSVETLILISAIAAFVLIEYVMLEASRNRILNNFSVYLDKRVSRDVLGIIFRKELFSGVMMGDQSKGRANLGTQPLRDVDALRNFMGANVSLTLFDIPWVPFYIILLFIIHPYLGIIAVVGALIIIFLGILSDYISQSKFKNSGRVTALANHFIETGLRNAAALEAMGMMGSVNKRWMTAHAPAVEQNAEGMKAVGMISSITKGVRLGLQIAILGMGGYLALKKVITPGSIIAGSIIMGRGLAPLEMLIGSWRNFVSTRAAYHRIRSLANSFPEKEKSINLPRPKSILSVEGLHGSPPGVMQSMLNNINFVVDAGEILCIAGASGVGKSTLAQLIVGVWELRSGFVRLGGIDIHNWVSEDRGSYVGYVPQDVSLFDGNVAENICRFDELSEEKILDAARISGVHDMILKLPKNYATNVGPAGSFLSGGQKQRVALARAVYNSPVLVVMDEPTANLDELGRLELKQALKRFKEKGMIVVIVEHDKMLLEMADKILLIQSDGSAKIALRKNNADGKGSTLVYE